MAAYRISSYEDTYTIYELTEESTSSRVRICPERGGIMIGCMLNGEELLYLDEATFRDPVANIRGGNPVLFPISGQLKGGQYEWQGKTYTMKNHGVARIRRWEVAGTSEDGEASLTLKLASNAETRESFPFDFELLFTYVLKDGSLRIVQDYRNLSDQAMPMYPGFHPYFRTDRETVAYEGTGASRYFDGAAVAEKDFSGSFNLEELVESVVLLDASRPEISFQPSSAGPKIRMTYSEAFKYVVLWSVQGKPFVCVEPWMAKGGELNRQEELVLVPPRSSMQAELAIACE